MNDLTKRLRGRDFESVKDYPSGTVKMLREAADSIEQLEKDLSHTANLLQMAETERDDARKRRDKGLERIERLEQERDVAREAIVAVDVALNEEGYSVDERAAHVRDWVRRAVDRAKEVDALRERGAALEQALHRLQRDLRERLAATSLSRTQEEMLGDITASLAAGGARG